MNKNLMLLAALLFATPALPKIRTNALSTQPEMTVPLKDMPTDDLLEAIEENGETTELPIYTETQMQEAIEKAFEEGKIAGQLEAMKDENGEEISTTDAESSEPFDDALANMNEQDFEAAMNDPEVQEAIKDPEFQKMIQDPEFQKMMQSKEFQDMLADPETQKAMQDPEFQSMLTQMQEQEGDAPETQQPAAMPTQQ